MSKIANARNEDLALEWSFRHAPNEGLSLSLRFVAPASNDVFVLDRLWRLDKSSQPVVDKEPIYRFERDGSLRLLLGTCPVRRSMNYKNVPHASRVPAGGAYERTISIANPLKEYSCYFPSPEPEKSAVVPVNRLVLIVEYVPAVAPVEGTPAPEDASAWFLKHFAPKRLTSEISAEGLTVLRHSDRFDRVVLAGEQQEPLIPG